MPFTRRNLSGAVLIEAGQVVPLGQRLNVIGNIDALRSGHFTLHHILPYRYVAFFGRLADIFHTEVLHHRPLDECRHDDSELVSDFGRCVYMLETQRPNVQGSLTQKFAWMGVNVFEGPAPAYRVDDPGHDAERAGPLSMIRSASWDPLMSVGRAIDEMASFGGDGDRDVTALHAITTADLARLFQILRPAIGRQHGNAHRFEGADWLCMTHKDWARRDPPRDKDQFRILLADPVRANEIEYVTPVADPTGGRMFWRLRSEDDNVPAVTRSVRAM